MQIADIPLGKIISLNGQQFTKISQNTVNGGQFMALFTVNIFPPNTQPTADCPRERIIGTMQTWNACSSLTTPAATAYTDIGCLVDERDGKPYEIRKFADGKCWMVDNLKYGGATDACASKTTFNGCGNGSQSYNCDGEGASKSGSAWGYGDCRDPSVDCTTNSSYHDCSCTSGGNCGYLYNWQAAMQHASAYYGGNYTGPTTNAQGICPPGWHLPTGNTNGEFATLDIVNGGTGDYQSTCTVSCNFWRPDYAYKGVYTGNVDVIGGLNYQGWIMSLWSAREFGGEGPEVAWSLKVSVSGSVEPGTNYYQTKSSGIAVRCIKN